MSYIKTLISDNSITSSHLNNTLQKNTGGGLITSSNEIKLDITKTGNQKLIGLLTIGRMYSISAERQSILFSILNSTDRKFSNFRDNTIRLYTTDQLLYLGTDNKDENQNSDIKFLTKTGIVYCNSLNALDLIEIK